jgi:competence CoiA-like predicted nuclease
MKIVLNSDNQLVSVDDLNLGLHRSSFYRCPECHEQVIYVSEFDCSFSYFKHYSESRCTFDGNKFHAKYANKMSNFHKNWQSIFPSRCLEVPIGNNYANIYLTRESFNLVIEIQNSKISYFTLVERQKVYINHNKNRDLLWIFNLQKSNYIIEHIKTYVDDKYRLKFVNGDASFMHLLNISFTRADILLDNEGSNLCWIFNVPNPDLEYIDVTLLDRSKILCVLGSAFNLNL